MTRTGIAALLSAFSLLSCSDSETKESEFTEIAVMLPFSGAAAEIGFASERVVEAMAAWVNDAGGALGKPIRLVKYDTGSSPDMAARGAAKLFSDGHELVFSGLFSSNAVPILRATLENDGLFVSGVVGDPAFNDTDTEGRFFRTVPTSTLRAEVTVRNMLKDDVKKLFFVHGGTHQFMVPLVKNALKTQCPPCEFVSAGASVPEKDAAYDFTALAQEVIESNADGVWSFAAGSWDLQFVRALVDANWKGDRLFVQPPVMASDERLQLNETMAPLLRTVNWLGPRGAVAGAYEKQFVELFNRPTRAIFQEFSSGDALGVLVLAIEAAGSTKADAVREKILEVANPPGTQYDATQLKEALRAVKAGEDIDFQGFTEVDLDEDGEVAAVAFTRFKLDGELNLVEAQEE